MSVLKSFIALSSFALLATACGQSGDTNVATNAQGGDAMGAGGMGDMGGGDMGGGDMGGGMGEGGGMGGGGMGDMGAGGMGDGGGGMGGGGMGDGAGPLDGPVEVSLTAPLVDPNTSEFLTIARVPGVGRDGALKIIEGRPYESATDLRAALSPDLTEEELKTIYGLLFVKVGLNSGTEEEYKLIPSSLTPSKLAHEFEEYRPYQSIDDFKREMAKYVDDEEVEYLTRFVTLD